MGLTAPTIEKPLFDQLCRHEGFSTSVYLCTAGKKTIGYGYNCQANPLKLSKEEIDSFLKNGIKPDRAAELLCLHLEKLREELAEKIEFWSKLSPARQAVLLDMALNMGVNGLMQFKRTLALIKAGSFSMAASAMLASKWSTQVGKRAVELSEQMRTGHWQS